MPPRQGKLIVVSGPSGVGKSTLTRRALEQTDAEYSISATTRPPRPGEVDGRDYHFVDRDTFEKMINDGKLLEYAEVFGNLYGTPEEPLCRAVEQGRTVVLEIDVQGGLQVHRRRPEATFVLIVPPSDEELHRRLTGRKTEDPDALRRRLNKAREELALARDSGAYDREIVNDDLESAVRKLIAILRDPK